MPPLTRMLIEATRYWEPRRVTYNVVLTLVVIAWLALTWPHFRPALTLPSLAELLVLGLVANVCYCAAYVTDMSLQLWSVSDTWRRWRWCLWLTGTLFAVLVENYWIADEIYPYVR
jgi:hypothetical protein